MNALKRFFSLFNVMALLLLGAAYLALEWVQKPPATPALPKLELSELHDVKLTVYYPDSQVQTMRAVSRTMQVTEETTTSLAQAALNAWALGPGVEGGGVLRAVPKNTPAPRVYVRGLHYFVDLPAAYTKLNYGSSSERMMFCTMTRTLLDKKGSDVTFLVDGKNVETLGKIDLDEAFTRNDCADQ